MISIWPSKSEQKTYEESVRELFGRHFQEMHDASNIWHRWVMFKVREKEDCEALLQSEVREGFKARLVSMMVVPDDIECVLPHEWMRGGIDCQYVALDYQGLSSSLKRYGGELICLTRKWIEEVMPERSKKERCRERLNGIITQWLTIRDLDNTLAERLFECHEASHPEVWLKQKECSRYILSIMGVEEVPKRWRRAVDARMRMFLIEEIRKEGAKSEAFKKGIGLYLDQVASLAYHKNSSEEILISQLEFLLQEPIAAGRRGLFHNWRVAPILRTLKKHNQERMARWLAAEIIRKEDFRELFRDGRNIKEGEALFEALGDNEVYKAILLPMLTRAKKEWEEVKERGRKAQEERDREEREILVCMQ